MTVKEISKLAVFQEKEIRRIIHDGEWWFAVVDVVEVLTESPTPRQYWGKVKKREFTDLQLSPFWVQLKLTVADGKKYATDCASTKGLFRIIQAIPSPKAEPFKQWLAQVGYERVQEIENPELAQERMKQLYEQKGYPKEWIDKRLRGIAVRQDLTDEWKNRGARNSLEFAILTNEIMQGAFDLKVDDHKTVKGLERENLRDHMTDMELILTMLAEATTTTLHRDRDTQGFGPLKKDAQDGGAVAGRTRKDIEQQTGKPVVSQDNFKEISAPRRRKITP